MGRACIKYGGEERCIQGFGGETTRRHHLEYLRLHGRIIVKWTFKKWDGGHGMD
jgi:hypothetical protein